MPLIKEREKIRERWRSLLTSATREIMIIYDKTIHGFKESLKAKVGAAIEMRFKQAEAEDE